MAEFIELKSAYTGSYVVNESPMIAYIDDVVTPDECAYIVELASVLSD